MKVSIVIPSRNETFVVRMVEDLLLKATGDVEIIVVQDGPPYQEFPNDRRIVVVNSPQMGLKPCVNFGVGIATGEYILKSDAHCMFGPGFDEILKADMEPNWVVVPRFYVLNAEEWKFQDDRFWDYFFLHCPFTDPKGFRFKAGGHWDRRTADRLDISIDETMQMHGSAWFMTKTYFTKTLGGMSSVGYDTFGMEPPEIGLKTWLGAWDGKLMVNKKTWYAHMHKGRERPRGYPLSRERIQASYDYAARYWIGNEWQERVHNLQWLVEKFWPVPTWPDNWRELWHTWKVSQDDK